MNYCTKTLWHSIRLIDFALQIFKHQEINFQSCNQIHQEIMEFCEQHSTLERPQLWTAIHQRFRPVLVDKLIEFKQIFPRLE